MLKKYFTVLLHSSCSNSWGKLAIPAFFLSLILSYTNIDFYYSAIIFSFSILFGIGWASYWWRERNNYSWFSWLGWTLFFLQIIYIVQFLNYSYFWSLFKLSVFCLSFVYMALTAWFNIVRLDLNGKPEPKNKIAKYLYNSLKTITEEKKETK